MEYLDNILQESLHRYFTVLEKTGYIKDSDVNKVLFLSFIQEFLDEYNYYITEDDYNTIDKIINCMSGVSCLIPYKQFKELSIPMVNYVYNIPVRITEDDILKHTESEELRLVNQ